VQCKSTLSTRLYVLGCIALLSGPCPIQKAPGNKCPHNAEARGLLFWECPAPQVLHDVKHQQKFSFQFFLMISGGLCMIPVRYVIMGKRKIGVSVLKIKMQCRSRCFELLGFLQRKSFLTMCPPDTLEILCQCFMGVRAFPLVAVQ
jgi:hypothetical protein